MANTNEKDIETSFITQIIGTICAWAKLNDYETDDVLERIGEWLLTYTQVATCKNFHPTIANMVRAMSDEELAQMMIDIAYENSPIEDGETYMNIPNPVYGGYLVQGLVDIHDTDIVVDALKENYYEED